MLLLTLARALVYRPFAPYLLCLQHTSRASAISLVHVYFTRFIANVLYRPLYSHVTRLPFAIHCSIENSYRLFCLFGQTWHPFAIKPHTSSAETKYGMHCRAVSAANAMCYNVLIVAFVGYRGRFHSTTHARSRQHVLTTNMLKYSSNLGNLAGCLYAQYFGVARSVI